MKGEEVDHINFWYSSVKLILCTNVTTFTHNGHKNKVIVVHLNNKKLILGEKKQDGFIFTI